MIAVMRRLPAPRPRSEGSTNTSLMYAYVARSEMTRAKPTWRSPRYAPKHSEWRTARSTTSRGIPAAQYEAARNPWIMSRSRRAASVEIATSPWARVAGITSLAMLQALRQQVEHLVDLVAGHRERRHEAQGVRPGRMDEKHAIERGLDHLAGVAVPQREREEEPAPAHLAVAQGRRQRAEARGEVLAGRGDGVEESRGAHGLEHGASHRGHERGAVERAPLVTVLEAARARRGHEGGDGHAAAEPFAERHDVGMDARVLVPEEAASAPDARLDLVGDEEDARLARELPEVAQPVVAGHEHPRLALDGLEHHGGGARRDGAAHGLEVAEGNLREACDLRLEQTVPARLPGRRHGGERASVEGVLHRDDLEGAAALARAPLAGELDGALVGLGAAVAEEHLAEPARSRDEGGELRHLH